MRYCLIGEKLSHSYSKFIHESMGLNYSLVQLSYDDLSKFVKTKEYDGYNVTIPYKKQIIEYLDELDPVSKMAGAVNTVINKGGKLIGYNTDVLGMKYMITAKGVSLTDKNVLILGSGGTSNTAVTLCKLEGASKINVVSRTGEINYTNCYLDKDVQIIINTTPVGMFPNVEDKPVDISKFPNLIGVFDCIYNPKLTDLLSDAKTCGIVYSDGLPMLVEQALLAEDIWNNTTHTQTDTEKVIKTIRKMTVNISLCGMPSCGKSTIGKELARRLNKEFIDTDTVIENTFNNSPAEIINSCGEQDFRDKEETVVKELSKKSGVVISLGGGAVLRQNNVHALMRNSILVYVKRDLSLLTSDNRPISEKKGIAKLYDERKEIYENTADFIVENNKDIKTVVEEIILKYESTCD